MIIYFLIVMVGCVIAGRLILGELRKERRDYVILKPHPLDAKSDALPAVEAGSRASVSKSAFFPLEFRKVEKLTQRQDQWEKIFAQKNLEIEQLTSDFNMLKTQHAEIEKIKALLERQIFESRQMNREIKRELDSLLAQGHRSQDEISKLKMELNYKTQLINQSEIKLTELKNRIAKEVSTPRAVEEPSSKETADPCDFSFDDLDWRKKITD